MILTDKDSRLILWGAKIKEKEVSSELVFISSSYSAQRVELSENGENKIIIKMPSNLTNTSYPIKLQNISFERDDS